MPGPKRMLDGAEPDRCTGSTGMVGNVGSVNRSYPGMMCVSATRSAVNTVGSLGSNARIWSQPPWKYTKMKLRPAAVSPACACCAKALNGITPSSVEPAKPAAPLMNERRLHPPHSHSGVAWCRFTGGSSVAHEPRVGDQRDAGGGERLVALADGPRARRQLREQRRPAVQLGALERFAPEAQREVGQVGLDLRRGEGGEVVDVVRQGVGQDAVGGGGLGDVRLRLGHA